MATKIRANPVKGCDSQTEGKFRKGEIILRIGDEDDGRIGVIMSGQARVTTVDPEGRDSILEFLTIGDSFGKYLTVPIGSQVCSVIADSDCIVRFISMDHVLNSCKPDCRNHAELVKLLLLLASTKVQLLSLHVNVLSQRTLRRKLMTYLEYQSVNANDEGYFRIPMTLVDLADYLGVDRSAMMREIHNMKADGLIDSRGRIFRIL